MSQQGAIDNQVQFIRASFNNDYMRDLLDPKIKKCMNIYATNKGLQ